jgi:glutamate-ammonia-ligase adenylyltransferase
VAPRAEYSTGQLARLGFFDPERAHELFEKLGEVAHPLIPLVARTADPDQALSALLDLAEAAHDRDALLQEVADDEGTSMRLLSVLGVSQALGEHLRRHPEHWHELCDPTLGSTRPPAYSLRASLLTAVGADPLDPTPVSTLDQGAAQDALRVEYRRLLLRLVARDLAHHLGVDDTAAELSDLAAGTLDAALAVARAKVGDAAQGCRLAVIAMGKCGGHELNYVSDVDVIFVAEPAEDASGTASSDPRAMRTATQLASVMMQVCSDHTAEGTIWPVDANLRPEGSSGPLVRTIATTSAGPRPGSSRPCSRRVRWPATSPWARSTPR